MKIAGLASPVAAGGSARARTALRSKWLYESLPLSFLLSPSAMAMTMPESAVRLAALPFWQFETRASVASASARFAVQARATGRDARNARGEGESKSGGELRAWERRNIESLLRGGGRGAGSAETGAGVVVEEVYAGYELPPSVAAVVLAGEPRASFTPLHAVPDGLEGVSLLAASRVGASADGGASGRRGHRDSETETGAVGESRDAGGGEYVFDLPHMDEDMAWSFVLRRLRRRRAAAALDDAARSSSASGSADAVAAVSVSLDVERRAARLVAYPAYIFKYNFEKRYGASGDVEDVPFTAVVGANNSVVSAVQHVCSSRSRVAGAIAGALGAGIGCGWAAPELGTVAAEVAASTTIASLSAGAVAARVPINAWRKIDAAREDEDRRVLQGWEAVRESVGCERSRDALDWREEEAFSRVWEDAEWRRWAQPDEWFGWNPTQREEWAGLLYRRHMQSERQRYEKRVEDAMAARQAEADAAREERKRARYGEEAFGERRGASVFGGEMRIDPQGYLGLLGLDRTKEPSVDAIKAAFRREALKLHPDMNSASSRADDAAFQKLHHAYTALMTAATAVSSGSADVR